MIKTKMTVALSLLACVFVLTAPTALAQDFCEADMNYDGYVQFNDLKIIKAEYNRDDCPPDGPAPLGKTGQHECWSELCASRPCSGTGEDGEYQHGVGSPDPRFTTIYCGANYQLCDPQTVDCDANTSTDLVQDNLTGLMWTRDAYWHGAQTTWQVALDTVNYYNTLSGSYWGYGDWRLPNIRELETLLDFQEYNPSVPSGHPFDKIQCQTSSVVYWSSTSLYAIWGGFNAWVLNFICTERTNQDKDGETGHIWRVRGGRTTAIP